jgi:hypothetical protein
MLKLVRCLAKKPEEPIKVSINVAEIKFILCYTGRCSIRQYHEVILTKSSYLKLFVNTKIKKNTELLKL